MTLVLAAGLLLQVAAVRFEAPSEDLREAQARFESVRRSNLPVEPGYYGGCDARIGRFCHWGWDSTPPPPFRAAAPRIISERERLLARLADAAQRWPTDPWLAGQRVRYFIDAGRVDSAATLPCTAESWWCAMLRGLALHVASRHADADVAFEAALATMPDSLRCEWTNLELVLEEPLAREIEGADCDRRRVLAERAWRLTQPLWMTGGNDARSEHLARHTMAAILAESATPHATRWGDDLHELVLRYGWSEQYTRSPPTGLDVSWSVLGHGREPSWNLMPTVTSLASPWVTRDARSLRVPKARMRYSPRHVTALHDLPHQLVRIPRGDSMDVAVVATSRDLLFADRSESALGVLQRDSLIVAPLRERAAVVRVFADTLIVSIETRDQGSGRAARARYSIAALECQRGSLCLSDLLLFEGDTAATLAEALRRPLGERVPQGAALGLWWHVRGDRGTVAMSAEVRREISGARRALEALRIARRSASTRIRWEMLLRADTASAQVALRLPAGARGRYRVMLTAEQGGARAISAPRVIEIQ
jgi:hypothetical protein